MEEQRYSEALPLDVLLEIFGRGEILSPRDVLRCRSVCKTWRDAATAFLLNHDSFEIVLSLRKCAECVGGKTCCKKFVNARQYTSSCVYLTRIISESPKFPSTSIRLIDDINYYAGNYDDFGNLCRCCGSEKLHEQDLLKLFLHHGLKIKSLSLPYQLPDKALQNILFVHLPNLECLDFARFESYSERGSSKNTILRDSTLSPDTENLNLRKLQIKTLILTDGFLGVNGKLLWELLQVSPNLVEIHNVHIHELGVLLEEKKSHLIQSFICAPNSGCLKAQQLSLLQEFADLLTNPHYCPTVERPTLREFTVTLSAIHEFPIEDYNDLITAVNSILVGSKDTLKFLDLRVIPMNFLDCKIKIPPMPKLVRLALSDDVCCNRYPWDTAWSKDRYPDTEYNHEHTIKKEVTSTYDWTLFQFGINENLQERNKIRQDYFPRLCKVQLNVNRVIRSWKKLVGFFALDRLEDKDGNGARPGDRFPSVTELEMPCFMRGSDRLSQLFPNICNLKITGKTSLSFRNSVWTTFPLLKKFEISEYRRFDGKSTSTVDSFFTGIPENLCVRFLSDPAAGFGFSSAQINLIRTEPYIGNCRHLTEFKIQFKKRLEGSFASKLSALYGFQELGPQTKILFSFESLALSRKGIADMKKWLAPMLPYIHILT